MAATIDPRVLKLIGDQFTEEEIEYMRAHDVRVHLDVTPLTPRSGFGPDGLMHIECDDIGY